MTEPCLDESGVLPRPDVQSRARSERLVERIRAEIRAAGGAISFARYMELALYAPGLGYYSRGARAFGPAGDFVTAPEISPLFSRCLARQCEEVLRALGGGAILELGAGSGLMAAELLLELEHSQSLPRAYFILELSGELAALQRETLELRVPHLLGRILWLERLPERPLRGVILGNEVLDAMPVHRFRVAAGQVLEGQVTVSPSRRLEELHSEPRTPGLEAVVRRLAQELGTFAEGYESEVNLALGAWIDALSRRLEAGLLLLIDYGYPRRLYYTPERRMGTLMCHYRHRAHPDPLLLPGLQDITAHVDFTAVAEAAESAGLAVAGFTSQAAFLLASGLVSMLEEAEPPDPQGRMRQAREIMRLTYPSDMGDRFKVMGLARGLDPPLLGFRQRDLRYSL